MLHKNITSIAMHTHLLLKPTALPYPLQSCHVSPSVLSFLVGEYHVTQQSLFTIVSPPLETCRQACVDIDSPLVL